MKLAPSPPSVALHHPPSPKRPPLKTALSLLAALSLLVPVAHADVKKAERMWKSKCQSCHGKDGKGQTDKGKKMQVKDLSAADFQAKVTDDELKKAIKEGTKREQDGVKKEMDAYGDLSDEQLADLIAYVRALKP